MVYHDGIIVGQDPIQVDEKILNNMSEFDFDLDYARKCIEINKHNHITATYQLLVTKELR